MTASKSKNSTTMRMILIAPCGMNCRICRAHTREKNPCPGCRDDNHRKPKTRSKCQIKSCVKIF